MARNRGKKLLALATAATAALLALTACTSSGGSSGTGAAAGGDSHLQSVIKNGVLRVSVLPDYPPFSVQNADGTLVGYEPDLAKALADAMGVKLELISVDGDSRQPTLASNRVDVSISSWTATDERAKVTGFTIPYVAAGSLPLFRKDNPLRSLDDLAGKKVSVARGSIDDTLVTKHFPKAEVVRFETIADAIAALKSAKVDVVMEGDTTVKQEAAKDSSLAVLDIPPIRPQLIAMGVPQTDVVWKNYLDNFIRNFNSSGQNNDLYQKWFHSDLPSVIR
jgi:polar amino acid transport system substrate-binding protein